MAKLLHLQVTALERADHCNHQPIVGLALVQHVHVLVYDGLRSRLFPAAKIFADFVKPHDQGGLCGIKFSPEQTLVVGTSTRQAAFLHRLSALARPKEANMSEGSKERSLQRLAKSRRDYLAQVRILTVDERTQEAAMINKALGIKAPKGTAAATTLDAARAV
jgi:hypothetical protein